MPVYEYRAANNSGQTRKGVLTAESPRVARDRLRSDGLRVQSLSEQQGDSTGWGGVWVGWQSGAKWTEACHELATLLAGGVSLVTALDTVAAQSQGPFRRILLLVRDRVTAGESLADALAEHPALFDELTVRMVEVGESTGNLETALQRLATFKQRWQELRDRVTSALIYPLFVLTFGTAATLFLMTSVMPPLLENLKETLTTLPWPTRVVKFGSDAILQHGWVLVILMMVLSGLLIAAIRRESIRLLMDRSLLKLPFFGGLSLKQNLSRISLVLSTLLQNGLPLAAGLELAAKSTANRVLKKALEESREALIAGRDLSIALSETRVIPPFAIQIFTVGQESGQLEELLARLAEDYDRQVQTASGRIASVIEPVLILLLAGMIGFVLLAIVLPILEAGNVAM